jgi:hypothetical protein
VDLVYNFPSISLRSILVLSFHLRLGLPTCLFPLCFPTKILYAPLIYKSRDSSVGIALGYGLDDRGSRFRYPTGTGNFSLHHRVQNGSGAHPASYPMDSGGSFPGSKTAGVWSWPLPSSAEVKEWVELYLHSPSTPLWRGAQLKHRDNFTFTFTFTFITHLFHTCYMPPILSSLT